MDQEELLRELSTGVRAYACAIFSEVWTYIAYGGGAVMLTFWGYATGRVPPAWVFLTVIALGFLVGGFRTWQKERSNRNDQVRSVRVLKLEREVDRLGRPQLVAEITEVFVDGDQDQADWIKLYVFLTVRNRGTDTSIDRWRLMVVPPQPATPFIQAEGGLLIDLQQGRGGKVGRNLLHDREVIVRGGSLSGWLLCHGPKDRLGLTTGQRPAVKVSFKDVHDNEWFAVDPPNSNVDAAFHR